MAQIEKYRFLWWSLGAFYLSYFSIMSIFINKNITDISPINI